MNTLGLYVGKTSNITPGPTNRTSLRFPFCTHFALTKPQNRHFVVRTRFVFFSGYPFHSTGLKGKYVVLNSLPTLLHLYAHHSTTASAYINNGFWSMIHHSNSSYTSYKMKHHVRAINQQVSSCLNNTKLTPFVVVPFDENFEDENGKFDKELFSQFLCTCGEVDAALSRYITRSALPQC